MKTKITIMNNNKVWFITGAGRGMGLNISKAALAAGSKVVATGRNTAKVGAAIGTHDNLLVVKLDVTKQKEADNAVKTAVEHFGSIDVLVNNAANCFIGFFEELTPEQIQAQMNTNFIGPMNVTRAVLPHMRKAKSGHIISISSTAGLLGYEYCSAYNASKFALEGWMEALDLEVSPYGINTTIVEPGFFRTELLEPTSSYYADSLIADYKERNEQLKPWWQSMNGKQGGDPAKLATALLTIANEAKPPKRWLAGADAIAEAERKATTLQQQVNAYRELSSSLAHESVEVNA
jgi:NAD(P)-dependent dehydrogenase (short-subunit alcohol dehydrogenase family)